MAQHTMGPSPLNHGDGQWCTKCKATDREIRFALGPYCEIEDPPLIPNLKADNDSGEINGRSS